jgi:hypothetical protein
MNKNERLALGDFSLNFKKLQNESQNSPRHTPKVQKPATLSEIHRYYLPVQEKSKRAATLTHNLRIFDNSMTELRHKDPRPNTARDFSPRSKPENTYRILTTRDTSRTK